MLNNLRMRCSICMVHPFEIVRDQAFYRSLNKYFKKTFYSAGEKTIPFDKNIVVLIQ